MRYRILAIRDFSTGLQYQRVSLIPNEPTLRKLGLCRDPNGINAGNPEVTIESTSNLP
jgi:hypothetical protein